MKFAVIALTFTFIAAFALTLLALDWGVERYKRWRDKRDSRVPSYRVGAFTGVEDRPKRWGSP